MSGPKVVRIVTREELVAICEGHLARVEAALAEWIRVGQRNDSVSEKEVDAAKARCAALRNLLQRERFLELQKQAPQEVGFLQSDQEQRLVQQAARAAEVRSSGRRQQEAARALLAALRRTGKPIDGRLESALTAAASGRPDPGAMAEGFALMSEERQTLSEEHRELAQKLKDGTQVMTLDTWLAAQPKATTDPAAERLELRLAELSLLAGPEALVGMEPRLRTALDEPSDARRALLLDSLEVDAGRALKDARRHRELEGSVRLALAELAQSQSSELPALSARRQGATSADDLAAILAQANEIVRRERERMVARARCSAVLAALSGLGYEVTEGLNTAWVDQGRVVLRKPAQPGYGVELNSDSDATRIQMRVVAFGDGTTGPDPSRDKDAETLWCVDVESLRSRFGQLGGSFVIERARAPGEFAVKRLEDPGVAGSTTTDPVVMTRTARSKQ